MSVAFTIKSVYIFPMKKSDATQGTEYLRTWIEIDTRAIKNNYTIFRKLIGKECCLMAVVKSNAYGHNLINFSLAVEKLGVDWFGVDSIVEGIALREAGIVKPILVLGYTLGERIQDAIKYNLSITVGDFVTLATIQSLGKKAKNLQIHLKVDTGMHRQGFFVKEIPKVIQILESKGFSAKLEGMYTHFSSAKDPKHPKVTQKQVSAFQEADMMLAQAGYGNIMRHAGATAGAILYPQAHFDMVRIGIGLYGLWPSKKVEKAYKNKLHLKPVLTWKTVVSQVKEIKKGESVGYDLTETLKRDSKIAILPIGYWHGFPRILSSKGQILIRGKRAKILGRVSMDMVCVDVTGIVGVRAGDEAVIIGKNGKDYISADEIDELAGTTAYEIVTRINPLIKKFFV